MRPAAPPPPPLTRPRFAHPLRFLALSRACQPVYGWAGRAPVEYLRAEGYPDLLFLKDREVNLEEEARPGTRFARASRFLAPHSAPPAPRQIRVPLPRPPVETHVTAHWLAVDGTQPAIPENPPPLPDAAAPAAPAPSTSAAAAAPAAAAAAATAPAGDAGAAAAVQPVIAHVISKELQLYFEKITAMVVSEGPEGPREIYESLATDSGLQPLAPYFTQWVAEEVAGHLAALPRLRGAVRAAAALLANRRLSLEQYLHQLMPALMTCLVAKRLSATPEEARCAMRCRTRHFAR
jgi:transcription initiation factor TFIID subunit 6